MGERGARSNAVDQANSSADRPCCAIGADDPGLRGTVKVFRKPRGIFSRRISILDLPFPFFHLPPAPFTIPTSTNRKATRMPSIDMPLEQMRQYKPTLYREAD